MERIRALSTGSKLTLASSLLLLVSLFFTWQNLVVDFGRAGTAVVHLDGWDFWGLLIGLVSLSVATLVVLRDFTETELPENVPWPAVTLGFGALAFVLALVKNLTDRDSAWAGYAGVGVAALVALGAYRVWAEAQPVRRSTPGRRRRRISSAV